MLEISSCNILWETRGEHHLQPRAAVTDAVFAVIALQTQRRGRFFQICHFHSAVNQKTKHALGSI